MKKLVVCDSVRSETFDIGNYIVACIQELGKEFPTEDLSVITNLPKEYFEQEDVIFYIEE